MPTRKSKRRIFRLYLTSEIGNLKNGHQMDTKMQYPEISMLYNGFYITFLA